MPLKPAHPHHPAPWLHLYLGWLAIVSADQLETTIQGMQLLGEYEDSGEIGMRGLLM